MLSPNAVAFLGSLFPKSKSDGACDELVELLLLPPQPAAARRASARQTSRTRRELRIMMCLQK